MNQYKEMSHEEVLTLQEELYKVPGIWQSSVTLLIGVIFVSFLLFIGSTSLFNLNIILTLSLFVVIAVLVFFYKSNWNKRRQIKLDLLYREKQSTTLKISSKMRFHASDLFLIYLTGREEPLLVEEAFYNSVDRMKIFPAWRSRFGGVLLTRELVSRKGLSIDLGQEIPFEIKQELML